MRAASRRTSRSATGHMSAPSSRRCVHRRRRWRGIPVRVQAHRQRRRICDGTHAQFTADDMVGTDGSGPHRPKTPARGRRRSGARRARPTPEEPTVAFIHELARDGLSKVGHHGPMTSMGVPRKDLPALGRPPDHGRADGDQAAARRRRRRHRAGHRTRGRQAAAPRHPAVRVRHELRRAVRGGQDRAGEGRRARRHRHLLR